MPRADRPRVGYVLKMYPRFSETFILSEILAHEAAGLDVHIFSLKLPTDGHFHESLAKVRAPVTYLGQDGLRAVHFWQDLSRASERNPRLWEHLRECAHDDAHDVHEAAKLSAIVAERGITHLHAHFATSAANVALHAAAMCGITASFTAHAKDIYIDSVDHARMRRMLRGASCVVTVSDYNLEHLRATYGADAENVRRIYNGLHLSQFPFTSPARREPRIVGVGRLVEKKGFSDLIDACAILHKHGRDFSCEIIGDGPLAGDLARQIRKLGLEDRVTLPGPLPQGRVIEAVSSASVLAAPCIIGADGNRDGLPTVLLEAMALGTPCVSTDVTGITEAIRNSDTGKIVPQRDAQSLADSCDVLLRDRAERERLAHAARALVERSFDIEKNTREQRGLFDCTLQAAGSAL
jgi:glycosyltransferase involved in cell wall biosynthesis